MSTACQLVYGVFVGPSSCCCCVVLYMLLCCAVYIPGCMTPAVLTWQQAAGRHVSYLRRPRQCHKVTACVTRN